MTESVRGLAIRLMDATDLQRGFLEILRTVRAVNLTHSQAIDVFRRRLKMRIRTYVAVLDERVVATGSMLVEPKYIHSGGIVAHLEDIAVHPDHQRAGIGRALVRHLIEECRRHLCYKALLDCSESDWPFYEKLGFRHWERTMRIDLL